MQFFILLAKRSEPDILIAAGAVIRLAGAVRSSALQCAGLALASTRQGICHGDEFR